MHFRSSAIDFFFVLQVAIVSFALIACSMAYPRYYDSVYEASEHVPQHYEAYEPAAEERLSFGGHHHHHQEEHHDDEHVDYYVSSKKTTF